MGIPSILARPRRSANGCCYLMMDNLTKVDDSGLLALKLVKYVFSSCPYRLPHRVLEYPPVSTLLYGAVFLGRRAHYLFENAGKIVGVSITALDGNGFHRLSAVVQQPARMADADIDKVGHRRLSRLNPKQLRKMADRHTRLFGEIFQSQWFKHIDLHECND